MVDKEKQINDENDLQLNSPLQPQLQPTQGSHSSKTRPSYKQRRLLNHEAYPLTSSQFFDHQEKNKSNPKHEGKKNTFSLKSHLEPDQMHNQFTNKKKDSSEQWLQKRHTPFATSMRRSLIFVCKTTKHTYLKTFNL